MTNPNTPVYEDAVAFNVPPNSASPPVPVWTNLTPKVLSFSSKRGRTYELARSEAGVLDLELLNDDGAFDPANPSSPYAGSLKSMRKWRSRCWWPSTGNLLNSGNTNLETPLSQTDGDFETTVGHWVPFGNTVAPTRVAVAGGHTSGSSMKVTCATDTVGGGGYSQLVQLLLPTIPGQVYTASTWVFISSVVPVGQVTISTFPGGTGTSTSATGAWLRLSVTWTASAWVTNLNVYVPVATTAGQFWQMDDVQVEFGSTATTYGSTGPTRYDLYAGYVERWSNKETDRLGISTPTVTDALAPLALMDSTHDYLMTIQHDAPTLRIPLTEPVGATSYACYASGVGNVLNPVSTQVNSGGTITNGVAFGGALAWSAGITYTVLGVDSDTGVNMTPLSSTQYKYLIDKTTLTGITTPNADPNVPISLECWFRSSNTTAQTIVDLSTGAQSVLRLEVNNVGQTLATTEIAGATVSALHTAGITDGKWHHIVGALFFQSTQYVLKIWVDGGAYAPVTVNTAHGGAYTAFTTYLAIGTTWVSGANPLRGDVAEFAAYQSGPGNLAVAPLITDRVPDHYQGGLGHDGELSGNRTARYISALFRDAVLACDTGNSPLSPAVGVSGKSLLTLAQDWATWENGDLFVDGRGRIRFANRHSRNAATIKATFSNTGTGIPYEEGVSGDLDPTTVFNQVTVHRIGGATYTASSQTSQDDYFQRTRNEDVGISSDLETLDRATYFANVYAQPSVRIPSVTVDAGANPSLLPTLLSLEQGDKVTLVSQHTAATPYATSLDGYVESIEVQRAADRLLFTFQISPSLLSSAWVLGTSQLGTDTRLGY